MRNEELPGFLAVPLLEIHHHPLYRALYYT